MQRHGQAIHLEETNQKILAKEGKPKKYQDNFKQYKQNRTFQNGERKVYQLVGKECTRTNQQLDAKEAKHGNRKNITEKSNGYITWNKNYKVSKKTRRLKYTWNRLEKHWKNAELENAWLCHKGTRGKGDSQLIDQHTLKES